MRIVWGMSQIVRFWEKVIFGRRKVEYLQCIRCWDLSFRWGQETWLNMSLNLSLRKNCRVHRSSASEKMHCHLNNYIYNGHVDEICGLFGSTCDDTFCDSNSGVCMKKILWLWLPNMHRSIPHVHKHLQHIHINIHFARDTTATIITYYKCRKAPIIKLISRGNYRRPLTESLRGWW